MVEKPTISRHSIVVSLRAFGVMGTSEALQKFKAVTHGMGNNFKI